MYADVYIGEELLEKKPVYSNFDDRDLGTILLGATGKGKTSLMEHFIAKDIANRTTAIIFDPHGEMSERVLRIGSSIRPDNLLFCEITGNMSYGFNPLEVKTHDDPLEESQTIDSLMQVFRKHWSNNPGYTFGPRVEWTLSNTARTILANPGYTLAEIPLLLHDKVFRDKLVRNVTNPQVQFFWGEYRQLEATRRPIDVWQMVESTVTRLTQFLANEWLYRVLYQAKGTIKFHELIESGKTIIFSLPIGKLGEEPASLLGSLLLGKLATTIFGRNEYGKTYPRIHIYIDEYARFSIPVISQLWVQARKFNCGITATVQTLSQIKNEEDRAAILQAGNLIAFQCIGSDADIVAKQMPLPDPVGLMKPEPVLSYSPTPIQDIVKYGHPNETVMLTRKYCFDLFRELDEDTRKEWFIYPFFNHPYDKPDTWYYIHKEINNDFYRSQRDDVELVREKLNKYYYNWMNHQYDLTKWDACFGAIEAVYLCKGAYGIQMAYQPGRREDWKRYLEQREAARPSLIPSPRELEQMEFWNLLFYDDTTTTLFTKAIEALILNFNKQPALSLPEVQAFRDIEIAWHYSNRNSYIEGDDKERMQNWQRFLEWWHYEGAKKKPDKLLLAEQMATWEIRNLELILLFLIMCGHVLEKEPVFSRSGTYKEVELNRRTYSDLREELVTKLVSLPPYNAIIHLASQSGELPIQIATPSPWLINKDIEPKAQAVREESKKKLGHPWQEVVKDIQTRQNLPPAKPQI